MLLTGSMSFFSLLKICFFVWFCPIVFSLLFDLWTADVFWSNLLLDFVFYAFFLIVKVFSFDLWILLEHSLTLWELFAVWILVLLGACFNKFFRLLSFLKTVFYFPSKCFVVFGSYEAFELVVVAVSSRWSLWLVLWSNSAIDKLVLDLWFCFSFRNPLDFRFIYLFSFI